MALITLSYKGMRILSSLFLVNVVGGVMRSKHIWIKFGLFLLVISIMGMLIAACNTSNRTQDTSNTKATVEKANANIDEQTKPKVREIENKSNDSNKNEPEPYVPPNVKPENWNPIAYNKTQGIEQGLIPASYHEAILSEDGDTKHLGKHLPYIPTEIEPDRIPEGYLPLMFGDAEKGYAQHPNQVVGTEGYENGHWFNMIKIRKATMDEAEEVITRFDNWPETGETVNGTFIPYEGDDLTLNNGKNTVYLVKLPNDVKSGDTIRVTGYCLYHGMYTDFVTLP
jgi:hypothetical protein